MWVNTGDEPFIKCFKKMVVHMIKQWRKKDFIAP